MGERPRDDGEIKLGEIKLLKARTRSIIDLVLYFEDLLEGNDDSGLTVEEKLHRPSYKLQWGEEKYLEMWGVRVVLRALREGVLRSDPRGSQRRPGEGHYFVL